MGKIIYLFFLFTPVILAQTQQPGSNNQNFTTGLIFGAVLTMISSIIAGYFINIFSSKTQKEHYERTIKNEQIDKWILELKKCVSEILEEHFIFSNFLKDILGGNTDNWDRDKTMDLIYKYAAKSLVETANIFFLLRKEEGTEKKLYDRLYNFTQEPLDIAKDVLQKAYLNSKLAILNANSSSREKSDKEVKETQIELDKLIEKINKDISNWDIPDEIFKDVKTIIQSKEKEKLT